MLDVRDMSEEDKLFNFLSGLQTWAQTELRRQGVKDLPSVIAAADRLVDFRVANSCDLEKKKNDFGKERGNLARGGRMESLRKRSTRRKPKSRPSFFEVMIKDIFTHHLVEKQLGGDLECGNGASGRGEILGSSRLTFPCMESVGRTVGGIDKRFVVVKNPCDKWYQSQVPAGSVEFEGWQTKQNSLQNRVAELESQVQRMMELLGQAPESPPVALFPLVDTLHSRVETLQKAVGEWPDMLDKQVKVPDPKPFGGARSVKELENFLWDIETYFQAARISEAEKVSFTSMYLTGDAKLWWRTCLSDDASANRDKIETWDVLKKYRERLCKGVQFFDAGRSGYVRGGKTVQFLVGTANLGSDGVETCDLEKKKKYSGEEKGKSGKGWKDGKFKKKKHQEVTGSGNKETVQPNVDRTKKGCYLCNGDHRMQDCPKRGKLNVLVAEADDDEGGSTRVNPLQSVSAL
ncbi:hypothetical protein Sango_3015400 [Sesamum angolense]|uniref:Retrotransposon gag domain-containing protein n=1 Tax=Sesamum angolense TaxID=2727404 RepID=A0AAE1T3P2_9LAMI|nr:hypothetical protein Sango_3015400 [Sesamum angolense]